MMMMLIVPAAVLLVVVYLYMMAEVCLNPFETAPGTKPKTATRRAPAMKPHLAAIRG